MRENRETLLQKYSFIFFSHSFHIRTLNTMARLSFLRFLFNNTIHRRDTMAVGETNERKIKATRNYIKDLHKARSIRTNLLFFGRIDQQNSRGQINIFKR